MTAIIALIFSIPIIYPAISFKQSTPFESNGFFPLLYLDFTLIHTVNSFSYALVYSTRIFGDSYSTLNQ